jgi:hypothetical protein
MNYRSKVRYSQLALALGLALASAPAFAQTTTANIGGRVTGVGEVVVAGAQVTITHLPSGTSAQAVSDASGRFAARGLRVGGPYRVTITKDGQTEVIENVFLRLAETTTVNASLAPDETVLEVVEVTADNVVHSPFSATAIGAGTTITRDQLESFASIQRDLQDYARLDPRLAQTNKERGEISVAGQNSRFNSITIDGVSVSDTFGLEPNNLPTAKQPISIDAIEEVQVNISNYDVTQRGYTGANINAVTRSGTNEFRGSVFHVFRNETMAGDRFNRADGTFFPPPDSEDTTTGFTFGGPILRDRLFFFVAYEDFKSTRLGTDFVPLGGQGRQVFITPAEIDAVRSLAQTRWGIDAGTIARPVQELRVEDSLVKLDWNIAENHRASLRYTRTEESVPIFDGFGTTSLALSSHGRVQSKTFESLVGQWFADWTDTFSTEFRASRREYQSEPINNSNLPAMAVRFTGGTPPAGVSGGIRTLNFGTERSRHFNRLATTTDDLFFAGNLFLGDHELKAGMDWSRIEFFNAFLQDTRGNYTFGCLLTAQCANSFEAGRPLFFQAQVPQPGRTLNDGVAQWQLENLGFFLQNTWFVNPNLTLVAGFRADRTGMPDSPLFNAAAAAAPIAAVPGPGRPRATGGFGVNNSTTLDGEILWQPRVGFNYTFDSERPTQLRGGFGLFQGSAANVWLSNPYSNTGRATSIIGCGTLGLPACPTTGPGIFSPNPATPPTALPGTPPAANVDFLGENLDQPSVWRANLAFEHELPFWGAIVSAEVVLTEVEDGIWYQHLNLGAPTATGSDGRALFWGPGGFNPNCWTAGGAPITTGACAGLNAPTARWQNNAAFNNTVIALPTSEGGSQNFSISLSRPRQPDGWSWSLAYAFTEAEEVSNLTSSVANSNWQAVPVFNANEKVVGRSAYVVRDRVIGTLGYRHFFFEGYATDIGLFYEGRKGMPYSWTFRNDMNGDGIAGNDLMYIPTAFGSGQVVFRGGAAEEQAFWDIVNANGLNRFAGGVVDRYSHFSPWTNSFDLRISQELPGFFREHRSELVLDILNVGNLVNRDWGRVDQIPFQPGGAQARSFVNYLGRDAQGRYIYGIQSGGLEDFSTRQARGESQWAAQVTFRYRF